LTLVLKVIARGPTAANRCDGTGLWARRTVHNCVEIKRALFQGGKIRLAAVTKGHEGLCSGGNLVNVHGIPGVDGAAAVAGTIQVQPCPVQATRAKRLNATKPLRRFVMPSRDVCWLARCHIIDIGLARVRKPLLYPTELSATGGLLCWFDAACENDL